MPATLQALVAVRHPRPTLETLSCMLWIDALFSPRPDGLALCMATSAAVLRRRGRDPSAWQGLWMALLAAHAVVAHVWLDLGGLNANFSYLLNLLWALIGLRHLTACCGAWQPRLREPREISQ
ncbi:hypothetical protein QBZ16_005086 [Prototheca wickerhamii]|uniref:Uncharacterized protein n=1 Tax=Prototheca wickerhamii TaxID=3111 RepID=A0AAD9MGG8_PROWI|nr:hypothetical protein QBZ16_005086 [Prototheca wickerhamii]